MSTLAGIIGSGAGVAVIIVALFGGKLFRRLPFAGGLIERGLIVLMYCGGAAIAVTPLGSWARSLIGWATGFLGGINAGIPHVALIGVTILLLTAVVAALVWEPNETAGVTAAFLPVILGLVPGGFLHEVYTATVIPGQAFATALNSWIGG